MKTNVLPQFRIGTHLKRIAVSVAIGLFVSFIVKRFSLDELIGLKQITSTNE